MDYYKTAVILGLLPHLLSAAVVCSFSVPSNPGATCQTFASSWGLTVDGFKELNPDISCPDLTAGENYCVIGSVTDDPEPTTTTPPPTTPSKTATTLTASTSSTTSSSPYEPTQPGIPSNCDGFHLVESGDQCDTIEAKYGISDDQFKSWNPTVDDECSNLWLDYYVCVHTPGATTTSAAPEPTATGPQPQMPGIVPNCKEFYKVKSGDSCYTIYSSAGITLAQFRKWNEEISADCSNLWLDYYVCVGV